MRRSSLADNPCSIAKALDIVGDPWTMLILRDAVIGVTKFDDFITRLGIPRATLAARLGHLTEMGVLDKAQYQQSPARWEYVLTDKGAALRPVIVSLLQWGDRWVRDDEPPTRLIDGSTGAPIEPVLVDRASGTPLDDLDVRAVGGVTVGVTPSRRRRVPLAPADR